MCVSFTDKYRVNPQDAPQEKIRLRQIFEDQKNERGLVTVEAFKSIPALIRSPLYMNIIDVFEQEIGPREFEFDMFLNYLVVLHKYCRKDVKRMFLFKVMDTSTKGYIDRQDLQQLIYTLFGLEETSSPENAELREKLDSYVEKVFETYNGDLDA